MREKSPQILGVFELQLGLQRGLAFAALFIVRLHPRRRGEHRSEQLDIGPALLRCFGDCDGVLAVFEVRWIKRRRPRVRIVVRGFVRRANHEVQVARVHFRKHVVVQRTLTVVFLPRGEAGDVAFVKHRPAAETLKLLPRLAGMHSDTDRRCRMNADAHEERE